MLFSEIYGAYFDAVSEIIRLAVNDELTKEKLYSIVNEKAFSESSVAISDALSSKTWPLITDDFKTPVKNEPFMPMTFLQKRWLKALLNDPRIKLFDVDAEGLEGIEPLYDINDIVYFDQYNDGDDYSDERYINNFRTILTAIKDKRKIRINFKGHSGKSHSWICMPSNLEYSLKDDKFRFRTFYARQIQTVNVGRIEKTELLDKYDEKEVKPLPSLNDTLIMELTDERNALERVMLHFSHFEKETKRIDDKHYEIKLIYEKEDETELLIRVLSFGPVIKVKSPERFVEQLKNRIFKQKKL